MWNAPNQRLRSLNKSKKRELERARRPIHVKRIIASIEIINPTIPNSKSDVRLILNDFTYKGAGLFSQYPFIAGQEICLNITHPTQINIKAKIIWCQEYHANCHVLSKQPYAYRLGIEFIMDPTEEKEIRIFCDEVSKNHIFSVRGI